MNSTDKTRDKLVASMRKSKATPGEPAAAPAKKPATTKAAAGRAKTRTTAAASAKRKSRPAAAGSRQQGADPYQARPRVWPD